MSTEPPPTDQSSMAPLTEFAEAARLLFSAGSVQDTLTQVVNLATATIEGCDFAGIFLVDGDRMITRPIHTDDLVTEIDGLQHRTGEGPCLDAVTEGVAIYAEDLSDDSRWPLFGAEATTTGIRSLLALPLFANGTLGALNLYARYPHAFGVLDRGRGLLLASLAGVAFSSAQTHQDEELRAANLYAALATRSVIGQAQGILIERERITADQAFDILRRASQHLNLKLREVAQNLVETGESPATGPPTTGLPPS